MPGRAEGGNGPAIAYIEKKEGPRSPSKTTSGKTLTAFRASHFSHQYTTTPRMLSPLCIRSKPLLMSSSGMVWVIIGSI